jgi:hypothetical protein
LSSLSASLASDRNSASKFSGILSIGGGAGSGLKRSGPRRASFLLAWRHFTYCRPVI